MRRPRYRVRTLLIAVAVTGLVCAGILPADRARADRLRSANHDWEAGRWAARASKSEARAVAGVGGAGRSPDQPDASALREDAARARAHAAYHAGLRLKYERAARCPWLTVDPDPPEPE